MKPLRAASRDADPTVRFSTRARFYANCRPGYPDSVVECLRRDFGLRPTADVADIGSGTGLSSELFLRHGYCVHGVEPNATMRHVAEGRLSHYAAFHSVNGRAEATTLPDSSADLIVCASAFHWFDASRARIEFRRLLRPEGAVVILGNGRQEDGSPFMRAHSDLFRRYSIRVRAHQNTESRIRDFFGDSGYRTANVDYREQIDFALLRGRILSYSTIPLPGQPGHEEMMRELRVLFDQFSEHGQVWYLGRVRLHVGRAPRSRVR